MRLTDYMCLEKKMEEDLPTLNTVLMHQYNGKNLPRKVQRKTDTATRNSTDNSKTNGTEITRKQKKKKNGNKNNSVDILSNKKVKSHTRKPGSG